MLRRLHKEQSASVAFTPVNLAWTIGQTSAIIGTMNIVFGEVDR